VKCGARVLAARAINSTFSSQQRAKRRLLVIPRE
jgi:hypothetical protein